MKMVRRMVEMILAGAVILLPLWSGTAGAVDDAIYQQQMRVYRSLNEEYLQRQEALHRLRADIERRQSAWAKLQPKLRRLEEKMMVYQHELDGIDDKVAGYEAEIKRLEGEAIEKHTEYWRTQRVYAVYQGDYGRLSRGQMNARTQIKKYHARAESLQKKINALKAKHAGLLGESQTIVAKISALNKELEKVSAPLTDGAMRR